MWHEACGIKCAVTAHSSCEGHTKCKQPTEIVLKHTLVAMPLTLALMPLTLVAMSMSLTLIPLAPTLMPLTLTPIRDPDPDPIFMVAYPAINDQG